MNVVVDGLMTNYQKLGKGSKTLVFLHGWADSSKTFGPLINELKNDYTILAVDLPGFGASQRPARVWNTDDFSAFVARLIKKVDAGEIYAFVGHSFGGATIINGLANGELKAKKLVLIASAGIRSSGGAKKAVLKSFAKVAKAGLYLVPSNIRQKLRAKAYGKLGSDMLTLAEMEPSFKRIIGEDMQAQAAKLNLPTLLIYGQNDDQTPAKDGRLFNKLIKNSQIKIIDNAGHFLHQENADQVSGLIKDFLK